MNNTGRATGVSGVLLGVLLYGVARTSNVASILQRPGREPWCWPVLEGLKFFLVVVLSCIGAMFFVLIPVLVTVVILFVVIEYLKGARFDGTQSPRRLRFMPFCQTRAREIHRFLCAIAVSEGNKLGVGAFVTLFLLSWLFGSPCA